MKKSPERLLQIIYYLSQKSEAVKSIEVGKAVGITRTEVFRALKTLKEQGYVDQQPYGKIMITEKGRRKSEQMIKAHQAISTFFQDKLGVSRSEAERTAYNIQPYIGDSILSIIIEQNKKN